MVDTKLEFSIEFCCGGLMSKAIVVICQGFSNEPRTGGVGLSGFELYS